MKVVGQVGMDERIVEDDVLESALEERWTARIDALENSRVYTEADKKAKGRGARGTMLSHAKMTEALVLAIRASPLRNFQEAKLRGVNRTTIEDIRDRVTWKHV